AFIPIRGEPRRLSFWDTVLSRFGEAVGRLVVRGRCGSSWWREVSKILDGEVLKGVGWFKESIARRVVNGVDTLFLTNLWLGGVPLSVRYSRLFDLSNNKTSSVADMCELGWKEEGAA
ncbi:cysteine-rich receptor-like protein kinase, partial [Trifolium pratense]